MYPVIGRDLKQQSPDIYGGGACESNTPCRFVAGNTGFEVREGHQNPMHSHVDNT